MFEEDLLDEEIKKKKRRVLVGLFLLLLLGTMASFPLVGLPSLSATPASGAAADTPTHTALATRAPAPEDTATVISSPEATPPPTAAATAARGTPTVTEEERPGGFGGGTPTTPTAPTTSPTVTGTPGGTPPASATSTPAEPEQLPVTGASTGLTLWLVAIVGAWMLGVGWALRDVGFRRR